MKEWQRLEQINQLPGDFWHELIIGSAIAPGIANLNCRFIEGDEAYSVLLYAKPQSEIRRNDGRLKDKWLKKYSQIADDGALYFSGLDPQQNWEQDSEWGRLKPRTPRIGWDGKAHKYESPVKPASYHPLYFRISFLYSWNIARRLNEQACQSWCERFCAAIFQEAKKEKTTRPLGYTETEPSLSRLQEACRGRRYGEISSLLQQIPHRSWTREIKSGSACESSVERFVYLEDRGFWPWVASHPEIPIILTEGEKKAQCLLSVGFAAIALPGIWCGRVGNQIPGLEKLHPDLMPIAKERKFIILFDYEVKQKTRWQIFRATQRTGKCIQDAGGKCEVAMLPGPQKGVDDWVVSLGDKAQEYLEGLIQDSLSLKEHREMHFFTSRELKKYKPDVVVNCKHLADAIKLPLSGIVVLKSDVGTGKTFLIQKWREKHPEVKFLNNGHRISLLRNLSKRLKTEIYYKLNSGDYGSVIALSITADSLWKLSNNLEEYGFVFIDEAAQYLWHLLNSKTLKERRHEIIQVLEFVVRNAQLLVLADAHISDEVIEFFMNMRPQGEQPFIVKNNYRAGGRNVFWYEGKNYSALYAEAEGLIEQGQKLYFCSNSKSAIKKMERDLKKRFPKLETEIRAIHGDNSGSPENVDLSENINEKVGEVFVLLCSPSLSTGVDINTEHFDAIIGIFYGLNQTAEDCIQQLWRIRPNIPMYVWVASHPSFGYRETNHRKIREDILSNNRHNSIILKIDPNTGEKGAESEPQFDIYCRLKAKRNRSINNLRQDLKLLLQEMGNEIIPMGSDEDKGIYKRLKIARDEIDYAHYLQVSNSADISLSVYLNRQNLDYLSPEELLECEKFRIKDFYGREVTPKLVEMDDCGRFTSKILEFEGAVESPGQPIIKDGQEVPVAPQILTEKDSLDRENYPFSWDWGNRSLRWFARERLGFHALLRRLLGGQEYSELDEDVQQLAQLAKQNPASIKSVLKFSIREEDSPNKIVGMLLQQLGLSSQSRQERVGGKRIRKYSLISDDVIFNQGVVDYRRLKREERERKLRQEQEDNERHRRALQFRYGRGEPLFKAEQGLQPRHTPPPIRDGDYNEAGGVSVIQCTDNSS